MRQRTAIWRMVGAGVIFAVILGACQRSSSTDEQVATLEKQVSDLTKQLQIEQGQNAELQTKLTDTQAELEKTQTQLAETQTQLTGAQAQLAQVGELKLKDGTYVGQVLGAHASPYRVIIFDAAGLFRVAQVASGVTITTGGKTLTLSDFGLLLSSTDPNDAKLAQANYQVKIQDGLVSSIKKAKK